MTRRWLFRTLAALPFIGSIPAINVRAQRLVVKSTPGIETVWYRDWPDDGPLDPWQDVDLATLKMEPGKRYQFLAYREGDAVARGWSERG